MSSPGLRYGGLANLAQQGALLNLEWYKKILYTDTKERINSDIPEFTGNVITVADSGGDYTSVYSAYVAAQSGDIIDIQNDINLYNDDPTRHYLILNQLNKDIKFTSSKPGGIIINQLTNELYTIRFHNIGTAKIVFENITINSVAGGCFRSLTYACKYYVNNCTINYTPSTNAACVYFQPPTGDSEFVFKNCVINQSGSTKPIFEGLSVEGQNKIFDNCTLINQTSSAFDSLVVSSLFLYDCNVVSEGTYGVKFGTDTAQPTTDCTDLEIRNCTIYAEAAGQRSLFIGRGVTEAHIVLNKISTINNNSDAYTCLVVKSIGTSDNLITIKGNYLTGIRPLYIKGAQYNDIQYNVVQCTSESTYAALTLTTVEESDAILNSRYNVIKNNRINGATYAIALSESGGAETGEISAKNCDIDNNIYYSDAEKYLNNSGVEIDFELRSEFWGNTNDSNSEFAIKLRGWNLNEYYIPV